MTGIAFLFPELPSVRNVCETSRGLHSDDIRVVREGVRDAQLENGNYASWMGALEAGGLGGDGRAPEDLTEI